MIWIVWHNNFNSEDEFSAAFSSKENAQQYIDKFSVIERSSFWIDSEL